MNLHLSFDDGPSQWTPQILDLLAEHDVQATFFVVGQSIAGNEEILQRIDRDGHTIGNHTWSHPRLTDLSDRDVKMELVDTQFRVEDVVGFKPRAWRAPYYGRDMRVDVIAQGLWLDEHVGADIVPEDCFTDDVEQIALRVLAGVPFVDGRPAVVSLHDGIPPDGGSASCTQSRQPTVDALRIILETLA